MDLEPYLERIRRWDPALAIASVTADPFGLNNFVLIVNDALVFRFPRSEPGRAALLAEARLLAVVGPAVDAALPEMTFSRSGDFAVYPLVPGRPVYRHDLRRQPAAAQERFAQGVGRFLAQLHGIPTASLQPVIGPAQSEPAGLWADRLAAVRAELYPYLWADQQAWVEDLFAPALDGRLDMSDYVPALIHNDLASYHVLADPVSGDLSGVLDFGEASWGDPAADLAALISSYGESFLARLGAGYPLTPALLDRARLRAGYLALEWALKGLRQADPAWYLVHIGRAWDANPPGLPL